MPRDAHRLFSRLTRSAAARGVTLFLAVLGTLTAPRLATAQESATSPDPAPAQSLFQPVKINPWLEIPRHAGDYPAFKLAWQRVADVTDVSAVWPHPLISSRAVVATAAGLLITQDAGRTFKPLPGASAEKLGPITDVAFPLDRPDGFYLATKRRGVWFTPDNGATLKQVGAKSTGLAGDSVINLELHAGDITGRTILAAHGDSAAGLSRSLDGGQTWDVLHKEHHVFRTYTARAATQGIYIVAARTSDPDLQGLFVMPSLTEPWQEIVREVAVTGLCSPLMADDAVLVSTADRGLLRLARGGGVVKRVGPEDIDYWASVGATWGPCADSQVVFAFDPKKLGMVAWSTATVGESSDLIYAIPVNGQPTPHSKGLYTNAIVREGAHLRASAGGTVFYAAVNSMLYRAATARAGAGGIEILEAAVHPVINRFDPVAQQKSLDQVREALAQFPRQRSFTDAGASMLDVLKQHDLAMEGQRIIVTARVKADASAKPRSVSVDLSRLGLSPASELYDDGLHEDGAANDGVYANGFALALLTYKRQDKDWRQPWPGVVGLTITAAPAAEKGTLAGEVVPYSIVNPGGGVPFWERDQWSDSAAEQGKIKRGSALSAGGKRRGVSLGIEVPGPWRARLGGTRKTLDISGAAALVLSIRTTEDSADEINVHLRDEPTYAQPVTTPPVPLLAEGLVPAKKFTPAYQRIVIPIARLLKDAQEFQPSITHSIILSGKAGRPLTIMVEEAIFSYSLEGAAKGKVTP